MTFLQEASKNDLIDIIISLQSQLGEEITEERFTKKNKWPLVQIFISLEDSVHCGHPPKPLEINAVWNLKQFFRREQNETEALNDYLDIVKKLAVEAGLKVCDRLFDRYVVARVVSGMSDPSLRDRMLAKNEILQVKDLEEISCNTGTKITKVGVPEGSGFDLLLKRSVPHIWEKIFLSLDYASFRNCRRVCPQWNNVLENDSFCAKVKSTFPIHSWMDNDGLKQSIWKSGKDVINWTVYNEEIAFVEKNGSSKIVHFIDRGGQQRSARLRFRDSFNEENIGLKFGNNEDIFKN